MTTPFDRAALDALVSAITAPDRTAAQAAADRWDGRAKPPGSLGRLESAVTTLAGITGQVPPRPIERPAVAVFAADHGVVARGVSAWPSEVTGLMATSMGAGGAAINAFAASVGASVTVVDVGIAGPTPPGVSDRKVRAGTADLTAGPAMSIDEAIAAIGVGVRVADALVDDGADCLVGGDMGIGNTTPSAALIAATTDTTGAAVTGPGAGLPTHLLAEKAALIDAARVRGRALRDDPVAMLAEIGGLEIAALCGLILTGAQRRVPVVIDGVIACAALCVADRCAPTVRDLVVAGHRSVEPAASIAIARLGLSPLLDLDLRLGEGTGACLAIPLLRAGIAALTDMADLPA